MADETKKPSLQNRGGNSDDDLRALVAEQAKQIDDLRAILMATIRSNQEVTPDSVWAKEHLKQQKIKEDLERLAAEFAVSCQMRTQYKANETYTEGKFLYKVQVSWCPEIIIRADRPEAAKGLYDKLCGIQSVSPIHAKPGSAEYKILDVTADPEAQALVKAKFEYKAAA